MADFSLPPSRYPVISSFLVNTSPLQSLKMLFIGAAAVGVVGKPDSGKLASLWVGTALCLSLEAIVKFSAPLLKVEVGLDVGRHVFSAVQRMEWIFAAFWMASASGKVLQGNSVATLAYGTPIIVLIWQTLFGLPALATRALNIISGSQVKDSGLNHRLYVLAEALKLISLGIVAVGGVE
jgi:hypothetical protein